MRVNYKFRIQIKLSQLTIFLDRSVDIEVSTFETLGGLPFLSNYLETIKDLYYAYFSYDEDLRVSQLDENDLNFLLFLEDVRNANFDNIKFNGDFVPIVGRHGNGFEYVLYANEG